MNTPDVLVVSAIGGAFSLLTGTIGWLYRKGSLENTRRIAQLEKRLDDSDRKHTECLEHRAKLEERVGELMGEKMLRAHCPGSDEGDCPLWDDSQRKRHIDYALASGPIRNKTPNKKTSRVQLPPAPPPTT